MPHVNIKGVGTAQFPDDMPISDIRTFLQNRFRDLRTVAEPAAAILSGAAAEPISGIAGLAAAANPFAEPGAGARTVERVQKALTFEPRSEEGKAGLQAFGEALEPVGEAIQSSEKFLGDKVLSATGSPALAAAAFSLPTAIFESLGLVGLKVLGQASKATKAKDITSRVDRAKTQGFNTNNVLFHGTPADFKEFDPKLSGAKGDDFGEAIYFSDDPDVASGFSVSLTKNKQFQDVIDEAGQARLEMADIVKNKGIKSDEFKEIRAKQKEIESKRSQLQSDINTFKIPTTGSNVRPAFLKGNFANFDAKGKHYSQVNDEAIKLAKDQDADGVIISNSVDAGTVETSKPSTVSIVFKPDNIRSIFDQFD